jgi:hypothetical protein
MAKLDLNLKLLAALITSTPEGFFRAEELEELSLDRKKNFHSLVTQAEEAGVVGEVNGFLFDPARLTPDEVRERSQWYSGSLPVIDSRGRLAEAPIAARLAKRAARLAKLDRPDYARLLAALDKTPGFTVPEEICTEVGDSTAVNEMVRRRLIDEYKDFIYDPLRITAHSLGQLTKRQKRLKKRDRREELRARLVAAFPTWRHDRRAEQHLFIHTGPTNSGKTYHALKSLAASGAGWYLAPLRLLAHEVYERLNSEGVACNLLTGEEAINVDGARITAATIEMFDPSRSGHSVVIDEAFMIADPERGWAWTRALMESQAPEIRLICSPAATNLIEQLAEAAGLDYTTVEHQRLTPLRAARAPWPLEELPTGTILVAFSRSSVLQLKSELERLGRRVSVIYGALPPEVRHKQAALFASGETEICAATDAVGMGLNLPADRVCFYELDKFDGRERRTLTAAEFHQIAGRAGRYGLREIGEVGAATVFDLKLVRALFDERPAELTHARVAPSAADLALIPGHLSTRLQQWQSLASIPDDLREVVLPAEMDARIQLASLLAERDVEKLGLEAALQLINAPARENSQEYWYICARAIIDGEDLPLPPAAPVRITSSHQMGDTEAAVACADIYLWLGRRREFRHTAPHAKLVRELRRQFTEEIDAALLRRLDAGRRCQTCRRPLPAQHRYETCKQCHFRRRQARGLEAGRPARRGGKAGVSQGRRFGR